MSDFPHTTQLHAWLERMRAGDGAAREELLRSVSARLERLARKMLRQFRKLQRWADTGDVLQNALLRLLRALEKVQPESMREFFGLAAEQMRRELLDLARHYHGPWGEAANREVLPQPDGSAAAFDAADPACDVSELEKWAAFHEEVARLPKEEREVVGLIFYHGWTQAAVAEVFQVTERTVRRWWLAAQIKLKKRLQEL